MKNYNELCLLMYTDDIALLAESEGDLQENLNVLNEWWNFLDVTVKIGKSQVVHFRSASNPLTDFDFNLGEVCMSKVSKYTYIGVILDYKWDVIVTDQLVDHSANRTSGLLI